MSQNEFGNYWWLTDVEKLHVAPLCQSNIETEYLRPIPSLMFHLAPFPCKQSRRILIEPRAAEEGENKPRRVFL